MRGKIVVVNLVATGVFWISAALTWGMMGSDSGISQFAMVAAIGASILLWIVWAFVLMDQAKNETQHASSMKQDEKSKRSSGEDSRLALLLQLMDDEERRAFKQRLTEDLQQDGEAVSLGDLLAEQDARLARRRG